MKRIIPIFFTVIAFAANSYAMQPAQLLRNASREISEAATQELGLIDYYDYADIPFAKFEELLREGADPNVITEKGIRVTPLVFALSSGRNDIGQALLNAGASIDIAFRRIAGNTDYFDTTLRQLVGMGANINQFYYDGGVTALMHMARLSWNMGSGRMLNLLENGADPDIANVDGNTALILATQNNQKDKVKLLLKHNANANIRNREGKKALDIARDNGRADIIAMFSEYKPKKIS
jgi:ankyrin repeat protein